MAGKSRVVGLSARLFGVLCFGLFVATLTGCATIVDGGPGVVGIDSDPQGATVEVRDRFGRVVTTQRTPATVSMARDAGYFKKPVYNVRISKEGYRTYETQVAGSINSLPYLIGNLIDPTLILGWFVIDPLTGAMWKLRPEFVQASLVEEN